MKNKLKGILKEGIYDIKNYFKAGVAFLGAQTLDSLSTAMVAKKYGVDAELNSRVHYLMENMGIEKGLCADQLATGALILGGAYFLNKFSEKKSNLKFGLGNAALYLFAATSAFAATNNFHLYYNFFK